MNPIPTAPRASGTHCHGATQCVVYGKPFALEVKQACERAGVTRAAVFTTRSLQSTLAQELAQALGPNHAMTFASFSQHTPVGDVLQAAESARSAKVDAIVALGGGSVIDGAKAVLAALAAGAASAEDLFANRGTMAATPVPRLMAVPTTLSGAEFTGLAGVSDATGRKQVLRGAGLAPALVVLDPVAALATPPALWLPTGMRAVDHAIETISSPACDVLSETAALRGLALLVSGLESAKADSADADARLSCQLGMWLASVGPSSGVRMGVSHGIGHILGAEFGLPHGITSCVMMTAALRWNRPVTLARQQLLEAQLHLPGADAAERIDHLLRKLQLPCRLRDVGITEDSFQSIAERSLTDFCIPSNPRPVRSAADLVEVLRLAA